MKKSVFYESFLYTHLFAYFHTVNQELNSVAKREVSILYVLLSTWCRRGMSHYFDLFLLC